ncbi:MAG TPA: choice-of-anchor D domain-containing protein, partial [Marmoricola sp.]|nr:choice-of-anchor D domain-containing protein [Marmoricola sp.]
MVARVLPSRRVRRLLALSAAWALPAAGLVVLTTASSSSALPPQCLTTGGTDVVCTFTGGAGTGFQNIVIPNGTTSMTVHAVGRRGGNSSNGTAGGNPTVIDAVVPTNDGDTYEVRLRNDGGAAGTSSAGGSGGRGGGSSTVRLATSSTPVIQAAGGGGAGNAGTGTATTASSGGNADAAGTASATTGTATASQGGQPGTQAAGGDGGLGGSYSDCTTTVQLPNGSAGVAGTNTLGGGAGGAGAYGGGGGGGGRFGGGGGAPGATSACGGTFGAGGGGGSSRVPAGATSGISTTESAVVKISFSLSPRATLSTDTLAFGDQLVGTNSAEQSATITNTGSIPLVLGAGTMTGANPGSFLKTSDACNGATLDVGSSCQVTFLFKPTATGASTATYRITDNSPTSPHDIALTGNGIAPIATLNKTSFDFGDQVVGTTSTQTGVSVRNTGSSPLVIGTPALVGANPGDFVIAAGSNCAGASVAPGSTCLIVLKFAPTATGARFATLTIPTNAANSPSTVSLAGTGTAPAAGVTPPSIDFGVQTVGVASGPQLVTLDNHGTADMHVSGLSLGGANPGDFSTSGDTCTGATIAPNASCTVSVAFTPTAVDGRTASLDFATDSPVPATVSLSGIGIPPADLKILATGSVYVGHDHLVTGTVDAPGDQ